MTVEIKLDIQEAAKKAGIEHAYDLSKKMGIAKSTAHELWHGDSRMVRLDTLAKMCELFNCEVGDLFKKTVIRGESVDAQVAAILQNPEALHALIAKLAAGQVPAARAPRPRKSRHRDRPEPAKDDEDDVADAA